MQVAEAQISVYIVDDYTLLRAGLRSTLNGAGFKVLGDCGDARRAVDRIRDLRPDVVLLDISMPGLCGLDAIGQIRKAMPRSKIVMLSHHEGGRFLEQSLREGADGYLSKSSDPAEMSLAIESVMRGDSFVSPKVVGSVVSKVRGGYADCEDGPGGLLDALTSREREVFQLLAVGKCNKEVAHQLGIRLGTAKKHRENLQRKLDCHSAAEIARLAIREGLLDS